MRSDHWSRLRVDAIVLGTLLGDHRKQERMSLMEVAQLLDPNYTLKLDAPTLSRIERGTAVPTPEQGEALTGWALQSLPGFEGPVARATDPETSHSAAKSVLPRTVGDVHRWWLNHLYVHRNDYLTQTDMDGLEQGYWMTDQGAWELFSARHDWSSESGFRTRRSELVKLGLAKDSGFKTKNRYGRETTIWAITTLGIREQENS